MSRPNWLKNLEVNRVSLVDDPANIQAQIVLYKRADTATTGTGAQTPKLERNMPETDVAKELADAKAELEKVRVELAELKGGNPPDRIDVVREEYSKTLAETEKVRDELRKQLEVAQKELEDSRTEAVKIRAARRREQFIKMAQGFSSLPGATADDFAEILDTVESKVTEKQWNKMHRLLTSWNTIVEKSKVLSELGRPGDFEPTGPEGRLHALAKDLEARDPKLTYQQAYARVLAENPGIYKQYLAEKRGA